MMSRVLFSPWYDIEDIITGAARGEENAYPTETPGFTPSFHRGSCCPVICVSLFQVIGFWDLIVPFVWLRGIYIFHF